MVPAGEPRLDPYLHGDVVRFGEGGDVTLESFTPPYVEIRACGSRVSLEVPFTARHQLANLLAAVAAAQAVGVEPGGRVDVSFGALRGEHVARVGVAVPDVVLEELTLDRPVVVLSVKQVRGLEFASVLVADPARIMAESTSGLNDLYVAITRATQRLGVVHEGDLPGVLSRLRVR